MLDYELFNSVIKSKFRFTYNQVAEMLESNSAEKKYEAAFPVLQNMFKLSQLLRKRRFQEGSVDFNIPEPEIQVDTKGQVQNIVKAEHNVAHELIEEFMLAANRVVAEHLDIRKTCRAFTASTNRRIRTNCTGSRNSSRMSGFGFPNLSNVQSEHLQKLLLGADKRPSPGRANHQSCCCYVL